MRLRVGNRSRRPSTSIRAESGSSAGSTGTRRAGCSSRVDLDRKVLEFSPDDAGLEQAFAAFGRGVLTPAASVVSPEVQKARDAARQDEKPEEPSEDEESDEEGDEEEDDGDES